jgi:hypothetical protein
MSTEQPTVDKDTILKFARMATKCHDLQIDTWQQTSLSVQGRRSVFRFAGFGNDGVISYPWSVVLKQIRAPENPDAPDAEVNHCAYWEREYLLYEAGVPQTLTGDLRAPHCFGTLQPTPNLRWIWLEDLSDRYNGVWPIEHYAKTAYRLGIFNGEYLLNKPIPGEDYIAKYALRCSSGHYVDEFNRYRDQSVWKHPLIQRAYPKPVIETLDQVAVDREKLLDVVESLPQTFCHLDAWHGNMAAVENTDQPESTVLFDWALAGYGAPGQEIGPLIWVTLLEFKVDVQDAARLETEVFTHYLQGLENSGWQPDPTQVRCAYLINSILLFGFALEAVDHALDEDSYEATEQLYGKPIDQLVTQAAQVTYLLIERIDELRALLGILSL